VSEQGRAEWPEVKLAIAPDWWGPMHSTMVLAADEPVPDWTLGHERYIPASRRTQLIEGLEAEVRRLADEYDASYGLFAKTDAPSTAAAADATAQYALTITRRLQALIDNYKAKEVDHG
jgi:hypothetical protein